MTSYPTITFKELINKVNRLGFKKVRQKGSHIRFEHQDGRKVTIPDHVDNRGRTSKYQNRGRWDAFYRYHGIGDILYSPCQVKKIISYKFRRLRLSSDFGHTSPPSSIFQNFKTFISESLTFLKPNT